MSTKNKEWIAFNKVITYANDMMLAGKMSIDECDELWDATAKDLGLTESEIIDFISNEFIVIHEKAFSQNSKKNFN